jgi:phage I-like protein
LGKLSYFIELNRVQLAENDLTWLHAMPVGTCNHPVYGELSFTPERLARFADNVKNRARRIELDIDYNHKEDPAKGHKAAGWIKDADLRNDGLWIGVQFTDTAKAEIEAGEWRYLSPEFKDEWEDEYGNIHKDVLFGAGLTNRPYLKDLLPIAASEDYIESLRPKTPEKEEMSYSELERGILRIAEAIKMRGEKSGV